MENTLEKIRSLDRLDIKEFKEILREIFSINNHNTKNILYETILKKISFIINNDKDCKYNVDDVINVADLVADDIFVNNTKDYTIQLLVKNNLYPKKIAEILNINQKERIEKEISQLDNFYFNDITMIINLISTYSGDDKEELYENLICKIRKFIDLGHKEYDDIKYQIGSIYNMIIADLGIEKASIIMSKYEMTLKQMENRLNGKNFNTDSDYIDFISETQNLNKDRNIKFGDNNIYVGNMKNILLPDGYHYSEKENIIINNQNSNNIKIININKMYDGKPLYIDSEKLDNINNKYKNDISKIKDEINNAKNDYKVSKILLKIKTLKENQEQIYEYYTTNGLIDCTPLFNTNIIVRDFEENWLSENDEKYKNNKIQIQKLMSEYNGLIYQRKKNLIEEIEKIKSLINEIDDEKYNNKINQLKEKQNKLTEKLNSLDYNIEEVNFNLVDDLNSKKKEIEEKETVLENILRQKKEEIKELCDEVIRVSKEEKVVKNTKVIDKKLWQKALAGSLGFVTGLGMSCVPGVGVIRMTAASVKLAESVINFWSKKFPDGKIAKAYNYSKEKLKEKFPRIAKGIEKIRSKLKETPINVFINGMAAGYITGNIVELATGKTILENLKPHPTTVEASVITNEYSAPSHTEVTANTDYIQGEVNVEPVNDIPSVEVNNSFDMSNVGYGMVSEDATNLVHLNPQAGIDAIFDKETILDNGTRMWHFKQASGAGYAWFNASDLPTEVQESVQNIINSGLGK